VLASLLPAARRAPRPAHRGRRRPRPGAPVRVTAAVARVRIEIPRRGPEARLRPLRNPAALGGTEANPAGGPPAGCGEGPADQGPQGRRQCSSACAMAHRCPTRIPCPLATRA
jgi:hypothetical protein